MTTIAQDIVYTNSSAAVVSLTIDLSPSYDYSHLDEHLTGALIDNLPTQAGTNNLSATISPSFFDLFYNKIHFLPEKLALGNVASTQIRSVLLWNAYFDERDLNAFSVVNASGINITPPQNPVYPIKPLEILDYVLNVTSNGDATINANLLWTIGIENFEVPITGNRISAFFYINNWRYDYIESWEYLTSIIRKKNDTEQRARLRLKPRKSVKFTSLVQGNDQAQLNNIFHGWQARLFAVPLWAEVTHTTTEITAGGSAFSILDTNLSYHEGMLIAIYDDNNSFEMIEIQTIVGAEITLTNGTINSWPTGTKVVPLNTGRINTTQNIKQLTDNVSQVSPLFNCDPVSTRTNFDGTVQPLTYNNRELWLRPINWRSDRKNLSMAEVDQVDSQTGGLRTFPLMGFSAQTKNNNYSLYTRDDIKLIKEFVERVKGRYKAFYTPTYDMDFIPVSGIPSGSAAIDVKDNSYRNFVDQHGARKHLYLELYNGQYYTLEIASNLDLEDGTQRISFSSSPVDEILIEDIKLMSILMYARLASDTIQFRYLSTDSVECTLNCVSVKEW